MGAYAAILVLFGLIMDSPRGILTGLYNIIIEPDFLITDYFGVGGMGAAFVNSGLLALMAIGILYTLKVDMTGAAISTIWVIAGFSLFGKNLLNVWFIILGVWLYAHYQKDKLIKYIYIALFGTTLAPLVTQIMFGVNIPRLYSIPLGILTGLCVGFVLPPLAAYLMRVHQGFNLYNIGFTAGIVGTIFMAVFRSYGFFIETRIIWTEGNNKILGMFLIFIFLSMILVGYLLNSYSFMGLKNFFTYSGRLITDFVILEGFGISLVNMGINGLLSTVYVLAVRGSLNGPTIGGIFTIVGFSAFGKHLRNMVPIMLGVVIGNITQAMALSSPGSLLAVLFGTTLAPIAGSFGWKYGIIAGFLHSSVVLSVGYLHGGFNLYNNGFSGGIVAATLIPIIEAMRKDE